MQTRDQLLHVLAEAAELERRAAALQPAEFPGVAVAARALRALAALSGLLTQLPAVEEPGAANAGVTFTVLRSTEGISPGSDAAALIAERVDVMVERLASPANKSPPLASAVGALRQARAELGA